ncbi:MAG: O-antigen/teichoic acid export membrane protein [Marivirga sp.]|jgi:O-antigen/teichoic acid export membrane protein
MSIQKKILVNASVLASGSMGSSILGLISFALIARILSPEVFGVLALAQAFSTMVDRLINFQSWQAIIKFGSDLIEKNEQKGFIRLLQFGFLIDLLTAALACLIGVMSPYIVGSLLDWTPEKIQITSLFSLVIIFNIEGTPTAILRIFDRFKHFAIKDFIMAGTKLTLVIIGYLLELGVWFFVSAIMVTQVLGYFYLIYSSLKVIRNEKINVFSNFKSFRFKFLDESFKGIWPFVWTTNIHGTVRMATLQLDTVVVDSVLGSSATGIYQVSKQFTKVFTQISQSLYKSIYPELTRIWAKRDVVLFKSTVKKFMMFGGVFGVFSWFVFLFLGKFIIIQTVGIEYIDSYQVTLFYMLGIVISICAFPITPAVLALGEAKIAFKVQAYATLFYFLLIYPLLVNYGLIGAGMAYMFFYIAWSLIMILYFKKKLKFKLNTI